MMDETTHVCFHQTSYEKQNNKLSFCIIKFEKFNFSSIKRNRQAHTTKTLALTSENMDSRPASFQIRKKLKMTYITTCIHIQRLNMHITFPITSTSVDTMFGNILNYGNVQ